MPPSSGFAAPALRFGAFGVTAPCRRGDLHPCPFGERTRPAGRFVHQRDMASRKPAPRAAVKAREAPAQRLGLDGEHGDGMGREGVSLELRIAATSRPPLPVQRSGTGRGEVRGGAIG